MERYRHKRAAKTGLGTYIVALAVIALRFLYAFDPSFYTSLGIKSGSSIPGGQQTVTQTVGYTTNGAGGSSCQNLPLSSSNFLKSVVSHYSSDASLSAATGTLYSSQGTSLVSFGVDNPGSLTDGTAVTTSGTYSMTQGLFEKFNASGAYPIFVPLNGNSLTEGGVNVYSLTSSPASSNSNACNWVSGATLIQAPGSGTSATTNVKTLVTSSTGAAPIDSGDDASDFSDLWNVELQFSQALKGGLYPTTVYGSASNPVTNYATGVETYSGPVTVSAYLIVASNQSNIAVDADPSAQGPNGLQPNAAVVSLQTAPLTAATREWLIGPLSGCAPAPGGTSATSKYTCANVPVDISETGSQGTHHADLVFTFVDMQQAAYIQQYASNPAVTSFPAAGQTAGIPTGFGGLTPSGAGSTQNSGNPNKLIESTDSIINVY